jgi:hypothetical protein
VVLAAAAAPRSCEGRSPSRLSSRRFFLVVTFRELLAAFALVFALRAGASPRPALLRAQYYRFKNRGVAGSRVRRPVPICRRGVWQAVDELVVDIGRV